MRCGAAEADITPVSPIEMSGFVARTQPSLGVHDPLSARALFLEKDGRRLLWLHADVIAFEREDVLRLKRRLFAAFGFAAHEIFVSATHTHSGPATCRLIECGEYEAAYVADLLGKLETLSGQAIRVAKPATACFAEASCDLGVDRRGGPTQHADHRFPVIGWKRDDGSWVAMLAVYAIHCVAMGHENRLISSDILGRAARTVAECLGGNPVVLLANGACGNVNPPDVGNDFARMEGWGDVVAHAAVGALANARQLPDTIGTGRMATFVAAPGALTDNEIDAVVAGRLDENPRLIRAKKRWKALMRSNEPRCEVPLDVHAVSIGGVRFAGVSGEVFSRFSEAAGSGVYTVGYANGDAGYICPTETYDEGGYEPEVACVFYGTRPIPRATFERTAEFARQLIDESESGSIMREVRQ